jgi:hypothetical protein
MAIPVENHIEVASDLEVLIRKVDALKKAAGHSPDGQALSVLHTDLRKCHAWLAQEVGYEDKEPKGLSAD